MGLAGIASRSAVRLLERVSSRLWNLRANLMADIVDRHGPVRSVAWFARNMPTYERILKVWGPLRTHYLAVAISTRNGCRYCTFGHAYAFVLHYFEINDRVFPISEHEMTDAHSLPAAEREAMLARALIDGGMPDEVIWLERTHLLLDDPSAQTRDRDDRWLVHLIEMFSWLNSCGIASNTVPDAAHDPINRDIDLRDRYRVASS